MNEFSVLMQLLTRSKTTIDTDHRSILHHGSHMDELCKELGFIGKTANIQFSQLMASFSHAIRPFGLQVRQNPFNNYWFITQDSDLQDYFLNNPFEDKIRLGATLSVIISLCLVHGGKIDYSTIQNARKKKDLSTDLKELEVQGFLILSKNNIELSPNLGYYLDLDRFLKTMAQRKALQKSALPSQKPSSSHSEEDV